MKRKFLSVCICLCLIAPVLPAAITAAGAESGVFVGEQEVTDGGYWTYSGGEWSAGNESGYNVHYDKSTATLTLKDFTYAGNGNNGTYTAVSSVGSLTLELIGENSITVSDGDNEGNGKNFGVYAEGNLTVTGTGSLNAVSGVVETAGASLSCGIYATGTTTFAEGVTVTASSGDVIGSGNNSIAVSAGVYSMRALTVESGASVSGTGGVPHRYSSSGGIYAMSQVTVCGTLQGTGGTASDDKINTTQTARE